MSNFKSLFGRPAPVCIADSLVQMSGVLFQCVLDLSSGLLDIMGVEGQQCAAGHVCLYAPWLAVSKTNTHMRSESWAPRRSGAVENLCKLTRFSFKACLHSSWMFLDILRAGYANRGRAPACAPCTESQSQRCERGLSRHTCVICSQQAEETLHGKAEGFHYFTLATA